MRPILLFALLAATLPPTSANAAEELGRLFFTPQQRQDLDRRRAANIQEAAAVVQESTLTVNGQVTRSGGKTTTWINRIPLHDSYRSPDPAQVTIQTGEARTPVKLKVGETHDNVRGEVRDALSGGRVEVESAPPAAR